MSDSAHSVEYILGVWVNSADSPIPIARQVTVSVPLAAGETIDTTLPAVATLRFKVAEEA